MREQNGKSKINRIVQYENNSVKYMKPKHGICNKYFTKIINNRTQCQF